MTTDARKPNDFCFLNLMTHDTEAALRFYSALLGWTYGAMPGVPGGHLILVGGKTAGALMDMATGNFPPGMPPSIGVMLHAESADATLARVLELGGTGGPAFDVMQNGRMAMCADPEGSSFGLWEPKKEVGIECDARVHGAPSWFALVGANASQTREFYCAVLEWSNVKASTLGSSGAHMQLGKTPVAQISNRLGTPGHWETYFSVDNVEASTKLAIELGATAIAQTTVDPNLGTSAHLKSPQGVEFHILQWQ